MADQNEFGRVCVFPFGLYCALSEGTEQSDNKTRNVWSYGPSNSQLVFPGQTLAALAFSKSGDAPIYY